MESGINADQNFYSRRPHPQPHRQSPERHHDRRPSHDNYSSPPPHEAQSESRSPQLPPKLPFLTAQNLQAVTANGYASNSALTGGGDPDEFYREYRGVQQSANGYTDLITTSMSATATDARPVPSSLRSNGNGSTPKHPLLPTARGGLKPSSYRSASAPLEDRTALGNAKSTSALNGYATSRQQPSVKDLLKRFDQNNEPASATARKPVPRIATNPNGPGYMRDRVGYQARTVGNTATSGARAGSSTRDGGGPGQVKSPSTSSLRTQRTRFATEDQHSNNTLSGTARATRSRAAPVGNSQASKSMTNLSPTISSPPSQKSTRPLLFGELPSIGQGLPDIGYGIPRTAARRTSDSSLHPSWQHNRSRSDFDVSPSSPTAWYLGVTPALDDVDPNKPPRSTPGHNRNHSDFADSKVNTMNGVNPYSYAATSPPPPNFQQSSRIPVASKRSSISSDSSSLPSTRASSPFASKTLPNGKFRKPEQRPWSPAGRATPTNRPNTPTHHSPRGKAHKHSEKSSQNSASLKAYISAPPAACSPPLRSSRPRQPVSSATTSNSGQKPSVRSGSPQQVRTGMKIIRTGGDQLKQKKTPEKALDAGPVDFAAHRAKIKRAYTKSIHESEQREIRAENLRRLQHRHAHDTAAAIPQAENEEHHLVETPIGGSPVEIKPSSPEHLHITTSFHLPDQGNIEANGASQDSPTLGMPGRFVDDDEEPPASAISVATGTTEIDNEPQTEAPRLNHMASTHHLEPLTLSSQILFSEDRFSPEQAMFGISQRSNDEESIQIMLDATPVEDPPESTPRNDVFNRSASPIGTSEPDDEKPTFTSTFTAASPGESSVQSSPPLPLHSVDEASSGDEEKYLHGQDEHRNYAQPPVVAVSGPTEEASAGHFASRLEMPTLREALSPPSPTNDGQDQLHTPITEIEYESSDGGLAHGSDPENYDHNQTLHASHAHRSSHQSSWTDYSVDTADEYSELETYPNSPALNVTSEPERKPTPPPKEGSISISPVVPPKPDGYSPQPSPRFANSPLLPSPHQLPPLSTGEGFGLGFTDRSSRLSASSLPLWPDYSPPPIPQSGRASPAKPSRSPPPPSLYNRRPPSSLYQSSLHETSRVNESRRASDDVYSPRPSISTPRSSTQISLEDVTVGQSFDSKSTAVEMEGDKKVSEKTKKRLFQRRMIIKELIDTEAVYLKDMNVVEEIYKGTAEACPKLDSNDIKAIFRNTDEIVAFSTMFLDELKTAGSSVYSSRQRPRASRAATASSAVSPTSEDRFSIAATLSDDTDEQKDAKTFIGANFGKHLKKMQTIYTDFLKNSELASARLTALQADAAVKVWLGECNLVAKDLTAAWDLDALLVKPVQRITRYQLLLAQINENTSEDHPDYQALQTTCRELGDLLKNIDDLKRRIQMVGKIVGRKRKESDVRTGIAKAFGRRAEKAQTNANRPNDDDAYVKYNEKFGDDYLRLQVVLRDVEFYTRQVSTWVTDFLRYLSCTELVMRLSASPYPELESKWARFNMSMRDMGTVALEDHIAAVRTRVIEPFEQVIQCYGPPGLAMKKRSKRRLDYEKSLQMKAQGKKTDDKLKELVDQYEALNETLKLELPKLSSMTEQIGKICLVQFVNIQANWYQIWQEKVRVVLEESQMPKDIEDIVDMFTRDYKYPYARAQELGIINGSFDSGPKTRESQSTQDDDSSLKTKGRPSNASTRPRGLSLNSDQSPSLPTPDFAKRHSGQFTFSPIVATAPMLPQPNYSHSRAGSGSVASPDLTRGRPGTGRSFTSESGITRMSTDLNSRHRRESGSTYSHQVDGPLSRPYSGLFQSAMPMGDGHEDSQRSSRASSRDRGVGSAFNVLYLAASLFEFNISATKSEAGYPYLTYQAGEIFDVIGEKGELWLAKNQDDHSDKVGWIWSKHFARLASD